MLRLLALALCLVGPSRACDTALPLAIDISGSIDAREYARQTAGLAEALVARGLRDHLRAIRAKLPRALTRPGSRGLTAPPRLPYHTAMGSAIAP